MKPGGSCIAASYTSYLRTYAMDEESLRAVAARLAAEDDRKKKDPTGPSPEGDPDWQKVKTLYDTSVKNTFKDLHQAIKDQDSKLTVFHMERLLESLVKTSKYMKMRDIFLKLKEVEKKLFD